MRARARALAALARAGACGQGERARRGRRCYRCSFQVGGAPALEQGGPACLLRGEECKP